MDELSCMGPDDLAAQRLSLGAYQQLDLSLGFPLGKGPVILLKVFLQETILDIRCLGPLFVKTDTRHLGFGIRTPADLGIVSPTGQVQDYIGEGNTGLIACYMRKGELSVYIAAGIDMVHSSLHTCVRRDAARSEFHSRLLKPQFCHIGPSSRGNEEGVRFE